MFRRWGGYHYIILFLLTFSYSWLSKFKTLGLVIPCSGTQLRVRRSCLFVGRILRAP